MKYRIEWLDQGGNWEKLEEFNSVLEARYYYAKFRDDKPEFEFRLLEVNQLASSLEDKIKIRKGN